VKPLPTSIKEKETHWPKEPWVSSTSHFISDIMDYSLAGEDQHQTNQPNDLAGG